jgi:hypothetical protein
MIKSVLHNHGQPEMRQSLVFVTGNANKLAEVQAILGDSVPSLTNKALDLPELQGTIEEITLDKARRAAEQASFFYISRLRKVRSYWGDRLADL